ncbi:exocyst complex component 4-like [Diaphorina citri]|uniref:Exocyst complex component Sec8 n=2 Tax=Diaphorina citri TaxID=121845 RepID=A0A3Q0J0X7_DIACI|nr:exocyst complex component 4-like [Diaphorina citri]
MAHRGYSVFTFQLFARLSTLVSSSKERITAVRENLQACKVLLSCRHEELKRLWLEGVEHKHMIQLLEDIEQIKEIPSKVNTHMSKKQYLNATRLLITSIATCEGSLGQVDALKQLRSQLHSKKQQLYSTLLQELSKHIYIVPTRDIIPSLKRQGSGREFPGFTRQLYSTLLQELSKHIYIVPTRDIIPSLKRQGSGREFPGFTRGSEQRTSQRLARKPQLDASLVNGSGDKQSPIEEDLSLADPEADSAHFIKILIESLILLHKLPDTIEKIKTDMESQLTGLVLRTTQDLLASSDPAALVSGSSTYLVQLLGILGEQFKAVLAVHRDVVLKHVRAKSNLVLQLYNETYVWNCIQRVVQQLLTDYLAIKLGSTQPTNAQPQSLTQNGEDSMNLSSYYARKKPVVKTKKVLFKFDHSSVNHFNASNNTSAPSFVDQKQKCLLVKPDAGHITTLYTPLVRMVDEFETLVTTDSPGSPDPSSLVSFLNDYVRDNYLVDYHNALLASIEATTKSSDAWRSITSVAQNSVLDLPKPLLQSVVKVDEKLQHLKQLMECLPQHTLGFSRSLPNWLELEASRRKRKLSRTAEESPETIRERNMKEAEMLAQNLSGGGIGAHEIISDVNQLKCLAQLQESMVKLSRCLAVLDEAMSTCLQPEKTKYIFEGIGDMIGKILMSSVQYMQRIDQSDVNKMGRHIYTLQQSIASITMSREISLDQARRYFHLLTLSPEEILNDILETGPQYTDLEYMHAIQLIHRSRSPTVDPNLHMNKLNDILTEMRRKY